MPPTLATDRLQGRSSSVSANNMHRMHCEGYPPAHGAGSGCLVLRTSWEAAMRMAQSCAVPDVIGRWACRAAGAGGPARAVCGHRRQGGRGHRVHAQACAGLLQPAQVRGCAGVHTEPRAGLQACAKEFGFTRSPTPLKHCMLPLPVPVGSSMACLGQGSTAPKCVRRATLCHCARGTRWCPAEASPPHPRE